MRFSLIPLLGALLLSPSNGAEPSAAAKLFGELPQAEDVHLSPDGNYLAFRSGSGGRETFVVSDISGANARQVPHLFEESAGLQTVEADWIEWKGTNRLLAGEKVCKESDNQDRVPVTTSFIIDRGEEGRIIPIHLGNVYGPQWPIQFGDRFLSFLPDDPAHVLIEARNEHELYPDVLRVDVRTGLSETLISKRSGFTDWMADAKGAVRLAIAFPHGDLRRIIYVRNPSDSDWRVLHEDRLGTDPAFIPLAFSSREADSLYVGIEEQGHLVLRKFDTQTLALGEIVAADAERDVVPVMHAGALIGYRLGDGPVIYLDDAWRMTANAIRDAMPGAAIELVDRSDDGKRALVRVTDQSLPPAYYLLDKRADGTHLDEIGQSFDRRIIGHVAPVRSVTYTTEDGSSVPAYVTLPPGVRKGPVPFVVLLHDGPGGHDKAGFDYLVQFLANRGYGVFQPQFRGSTSPSANLGTDIQETEFGIKPAQPAAEQSGSAGGMSNSIGAQARKTSSLDSVRATSIAAYNAYIGAFTKRPNASAYYEQALFHGDSGARPGPREDSIVDRDYVGLSDGVWTRYSRAGYGQWGRSVEDDIIDGTRWLISQGFADPERICIAGTGFGGYSALVGVARDPYLFRCAAALAPITDLSRTADDARAFLNGNYVRGYLNANGDSLSNISPVALADRIDVPVLLVQGRQDCEVPAVQTEEMEAALRRTREKMGSVDIASLHSREPVRTDRAKTPRPARSVTAVYLDSADHALSREADRVAYLTALETFLGANLAPGN